MCAYGTFSYITCNAMIFQGDFRVMTIDEVVDTYKTRFGIRTISYTTEGFYLNGKKIKFNGKKSSKLRFVLATFGNQSTLFIKALRPKATNIISAAGVIFFPQLEQCTAHRAALIG